MIFVHSFAGLWKLCDAARRMNDGVLHAASLSVCHVSFSHWRSRLASLAVTGQTQVRFLVVTLLSVLTIEIASSDDPDTFL